MEASDRTSCSSSGESSANSFTDILKLFLLLVPERTLTSESASEEATSEGVGDATPPSGDGVGMAS